MQFRPDIQGLPAVAVLAVIIFHLNPALLPGGFVGSEFVSDAYTKIDVLPI